MYPNKAKIGSVFEPDKAPSVGLTLGLLDRPFDLRNSVVFGQFDENPGKAAFSDSNGRIRISVLKSEKGENSRWNALERGVAVTDEEPHYGNWKKEPDRNSEREKSDKERTFDFWLDRSSPSQERSAVGRIRPSERLKSVPSIDASGSDHAPRASVPSIDASGSDHAPRAVMAC
ncbi:hypothetical protein F2Q70_00029931 [Brassica cretica]|uniref:Uncharacterized protein n=1 Tax=Brassica cretica TaxID=69181 RepID=A0A8S9FP01_BRACR|nr:hypothetical protein F2Q70_00029931 [Brassica cretica]